MAAHNKSRTRSDGGRTNLVSALQRSRKTSVQAAVSAAAEEVKKSVTAFQALSAPLVRPESTVDGTNACSRSLSVWLAGFAHWAYETDVYFGARGEDVRAFGWVFEAEDVAKDTDAMISH